MKNLDNRFRLAEGGAVISFGIILIGVYFENNSSNILPILGSGLLILCGVGMILFSKSSTGRK